MTKASRERRGRGRPPIYDPSVISSLLAERELTGETYVDLETRSGIPAATLASRSRRKPAERPMDRGGFVELIVSEDSRSGEDSSGHFEVIVPTRHGPRHVVVPVGFDSGELRRLVGALEDPC